MMTLTKLRDRDAIITKEDIILRVYGYTHPPDAYICDPEYAPESIYKSVDPRAIRKAPNQKLAYYKFYFDQGLRFIQQNYPKYTIDYTPLQTRLVGVKQEDTKTVRNPQQKFQQLVANPPRDKLIESLQNLFDTLRARTTLSTDDFGVFGSLLHGFHHPQHSDLDLVIYSREGLKALQQLLKQVYKDNDSSLRNEFESEEAIKGKQWRFENYSPKEYVWHQRRKLIYALYKSVASERIVKTEFEPVKSWEEITNEYNPTQRIIKEGWIKAQARITDDKDAAFMPSIYQIEPLKIVTSQSKPDNIKRILSYVEEFRMQAKRDETIVVEGNLEKVATQKGSFHQITLTYGPRYYEQVLKVVKPEL
jgi:predicted nucleotidyltransferase